MVEEKCSCVNLPPVNFFARFPENCGYKTGIATVILNDNYFLNHEKQQEGETHRLCFVVKSMIDLEFRLFFAGLQPYCVDSAISMRIPFTTELIFYLFVTNKEKLCSPTINQ